MESQNDNLREELEALKRENEKLKASQSRPSRGEIHFKVSPKGAVSVYGMGRFPVTLYKEQWIRLLDKSDELKEFIAENDELLKTKD